MNCLKRSSSSSCRGASTDKIKKSNNLKKVKIKLDGSRKDVKKNLSWHFWELWDELLNRIQSEYGCCIKRVHRMY